VVHGIKQIYYFKREETWYLKGGYGVEKLRSYAMLPRYEVENLLDLSPSTTSR